MYSLDNDSFLNSLEIMADESVVVPIRWTRHGDSDV